MFLILNLDTKEQAFPDLWDDGAACATHCKGLNDLAGRKLYQPRPAPAAPDIDWRAREQSRFASGVYMAPTVNVSRYARADHYLHVSRDKPAVLAYTADDEKGRRDIQTRIKIETYLERFAPALDSDERGQFAREHLAQFIATDLKFAVTADEIETVYTTYDRSQDGLNVSCMRYKASHFHDECPEHPVRVYATDGGDHHLAIAYLANDEGQTISRALCYPRGKIYSRVYGAPRLHDLLKAAGFRKGSYYQGEDADAPSMNGARLSCVHVRDDAYLMPYIDGGENLELIRVNGARYFEMSDSGSSDYDTQRTDGLSRDLEDENTGWCERCEDSCDADETSMVYTRFRNGRLAGEQCWCESCGNDHTFYCQGFEERLDDAMDSIEVGGATYSLAYAEMNFNYCERADEWHDGESVSVIVDSRGNEESWSRDAADDDAFESRDGYWYLNELRHPDSPDSAPYALGDEPDAPLPANPDENQLGLSL